MPGRQRTVYMDDKDAEDLKILGGGNLSRGIRILIKGTHTNTDTPPKLTPLISDVVTAAGALDAEMHRLKATAAAKAHAEAQVKVVQIQQYDALSDEEYRAEQRSRQSEAVGFRVRMGTQQGIYDRNVLLIKKLLAEAGNTAQVILADDYPHPTVASRLLRYTERRDSADTQMGDIRAAIDSIESSINRARDKQNANQCVPGNTLGTGVSRNAREAQASEARLYDHADDQPGSYMRPSGDVTEKDFEDDELDPDGDPLA